MPLSQGYGRSGMTVLWSCHAGVTPGMCGWNHRRAANDRLGNYSLIFGGARHCQIQWFQKFIKNLNLWKIGDDLQEALAIGSSEFGEMARMEVTLFRSLGFECMSPTCWELGQQQHRHHRKMEIKLGSLYQEVHFTLIVKQRGEGSTGLYETACLWDQMLLEVKH